MAELWLIGIGTGNPDHVTGEARQAIRAADLILLPEKGAGKADLADLRRQIVDQVAAGDAPPVAAFAMPERDADLPYLAAVDAWHADIAGRWRAAMAAHPGARRIALLVWGDPSLYDSTLRIAARLDPAPKIRVVPGITALQALTAAHAIPLNTVGGPILVTTGRRLRATGWPEGADTLAVMLDGTCAFQVLDGSAFDIWWGAYLGMQHQILCHGPLDRVADEIMDLRETARAEHGWIMDTYLLRRRATEPFAKPI
ncbi:MAG: precorrin-6A synthase (deacetylating) [Marinibacterium sp.]